MGDNTVIIETNLNNKYEILEIAEEVNEDSQMDSNSDSKSLDDFLNSTSSYDSVLTVTPCTEGYNDAKPVLFRDFSVDDLHVPIIGYEIMEERARFTVYKLRVSYDNRQWMVYRRYTDFVRLATSLRNTHPILASLCPKKRWFRDNFNPDFINDRISRLQIFINSILVPELMMVQSVQDFFCLNDSPPLDNVLAEDDKSMCDTLLETIKDLQNVLNEKNEQIVKLNEDLNKEILSNKALKMFVSTQISTCDNCRKSIDVSQEVKDILSSYNNNE